MPLKKIAAYTSSPAAAVPVVVVREYDQQRDKAAVEELEHRCELGQPGKPSLVTDLMGDPLARIRNFASHIMLVGEYGSEGEIVGIIRGCIKTVTSWDNGEAGSQTLKLGYVLGLRVSSAHRRIGIATKLVRQVEAWCKRKGAEYAYMATDCNNLACLNLFTKKCNYVKFLNPTVLIQPLLHRCIPLPRDIEILHLNPGTAASLYMRLFSGSEFFPEDIDHLLENKLNLGTFMAFPRDSAWPPKGGILEDLPASFAVLSIWNTKQVFQLQVKGVSAVKRLACLGTRVVDGMAPWLRIPWVPNVFKKFGFYFLYGLHMEGQDCGRMMRALCSFAHNKAMSEDGCRAVVAEVGQTDAVKAAIPHWDKYSCTDVWCIKRLVGEEEGTRKRWKFGPKGAALFVDPRDV